MKKLSFTSAPKMQVETFCKWADGKSLTYTKVDDGFHVWPTDKKIESDLTVVSSILFPDSTLTDVVIDVAPSVEAAPVGTERERTQYHFLARLRAHTGETLFVGIMDQILSYHEAEDKFVASIRRVKYVETTRRYRVIDTKVQLIIWTRSGVKWVKDMVEVAVENAPDSIKVGDVLTPEQSWERSRAEAESIDWNKPAFRRAVEAEKIVRAILPS